MSHSELLSGQGSRVSRPARHHHGYHVLHVVVVINLGFVLNLVSVADAGESTSNFDLLDLGKTNRIGCWSSAGGLGESNLSVCGDHVASNHTALKTPFRIANTFSARCVGPLETRAAQDDARGAYPWRARRARPTCARKRSGADVV